MISFNKAMNILSKKLFLSKKILVVLSSLVFATAGFYLGLKLYPNIYPSVFEQFKNQSPASCPETLINHYCDSFGKYEDEYVTFDTSGGWQILTNYGYSLSYLVYNKTEYTQPKMNLHVEIQNWGAPRGNSSSMTEEEIIEENKEWDFSSRSNIGGAGPEQIEKSYTTVNNKPAIKYVFKLHGDMGEYDRGGVNPIVVWYMLHHQNKLVKFSFNDVEQEVIDKFFESFILKDNFTN